MNKLLTLTKRNLKEFTKDPLSLVFCIIFPLVMLVLLQLIFTNMEFIPGNFHIQNYIIGICVFGFTFDMLFVAMNIANDRHSQFINRIYMAPINKTTYLISQILAMLPIILIQMIFFFAVSLIFDLPITPNILLAIIYLIPSALFYLTFGVLIGILCKNEKQSGPISSIIISLTGIFGGIFMPLENLNGGFQTLVNLLPFSHTTNIAQGVFTNPACIYPHILWVLGYTAILWILISLIYKNKN